MARRDAQALLGSLRLPPGTTRITTQPPLPALAPPRITAENTVGVSAWWRSHTAPAAVLAYLKAHQPRARGVAQVITEPPSTMILIWTIDGTHLYSQQLRLTAATLADGQTGIMAQAESTWMVPRPLSERVPGGVRSVAVTLRIGSGPEGMKHQRTHHYRFTGAARVTSIVSAIDALPIRQPGVFFGCPVIFTGMPRLTLRFLSGAGSMLALAQVNAYPGRHGGSGWNGCDPINFWIGGKRQTPLTSHTFVRQIARLIGANIS